MVFHGQRREESDVKSRDKGSSMRILVVEDDAPLASFLSKGLEAEHYAVDVAPDGEEARWLVSECEYDLLLLDLNLPKLDGISLLRVMRPKKPSLPVLVLTGRNRIEDRVQALDSGADDCLLKPFSFTELSARVRALMRRRPVAAELVLKVGDLELNRVERTVRRAGKRIRADIERVRTAGVPGAERRASHHAQHDRGACVEPLVRYGNQRRGRLHQLPAKEGG